MLTNILILLGIAVVASVGTWLFIKNNKSKADAVNDAIDKVKKK